MPLPLPLRMLAAVACVLASASCAVAQPTGPAAAPSGEVDAQNAELLPPPLPGGNAGRGMTLDALEAVATRHHPRLVEAASHVEAARGSWIQAGRYPNPVVGYHATEIGNFNTAAQQGAFVSQRFITGGKRRLDRAVAVSTVEQARLDFNADRLRVLSDVRLRFYDALAEQRRAELTRRLAEIAEESVQASKTLLEARRVSENAVLQAEIEAESAHILADNANNGLVASWRRLAAAAGVPQMTPTTLIGDLEAELPQLKWEACLNHLLGQSPELAAAAMRVERAQYALLRARRQRIPDVDVNVSVRHHNVTTFDVANIQVGLPIPIFDANQGNIRRATAELVAARSRVRQIELQLHDRLAVAFRSYGDARQQVQRYAERILPRARASLEQVRTGYRQQQLDYLTLLTTQQTYVRVSLAHLDALQRLRAACTRINGFLLDSSEQ